MDRLFPLRFRFLDGDDVAAYGDGWHAWDEPALARLRGRELIELEEVVGRPLVGIINGLRDPDDPHHTLASMQAMWIAVHREGHQVAWADFNPAVYRAEWEEVPQVPLGSGAAATTEPNSSPEPSTGSATS